MDIPDYLRNIETKHISQENYHQDLNQALKENIGTNGFVITSITNADLTVTPILNPNSGQSTTVADLMPPGTIWFVTDGAPASWVGKISESPTVLVRFDTSPYP